MGSVCVRNGCIGRIHCTHLQRSLQIKRTTVCVYVYLVMQITLVAAKWRRIDEQNNEHNDCRSHASNIQHTCSKLIQIHKIHKIISLKLCQILQQIQLKLLNLTFHIRYIKHGHLFKTAPSAHGMCEMRECVGIESSIDIDTIYKYIGNATRSGPMIFLVLCRGFYLLDFSHFLGVRGMSLQIGTLCNFFALHIFMEQPQALEPARSQI